LVIKQGEDALGLTLGRKDSLIDYCSPLVPKRKKRPDERYHKVGHYGSARQTGNGQQLKGNPGKRWVLNGDIVSDRLEVKSDHEKTFRCRDGKWLGRK